VRGVEVFVPSPLLASGMCFVDTPGLGSVFSGNTAATEAFIPHIDAALAVIGADPPLAGEELRLVEAVAQQVRDLVFVLNKADRTTPEEKSAAMNFADRQLQKHLHRGIGPILEVSASERIENRGPERDWRKLVDSLNGLVEESGRQLIYSACHRGLARLSEQLVVVIREDWEAVERPIEESERRIAAMKATIIEAERSMRELVFLLMAEQQRISDLFVGRHKTFLATILPKAHEEFEKAIPSLRHVLGPNYRRRMMKSAQEIAKRYVIPWLKPEQEEAERQYRGVSRRFVDMGNGFLKKLADEGIPELRLMPHGLDPETGFRVRSRFTFADFIEIAQPASPLRWLADTVISFMGARGIIENDARKFLTKLVEVNSTRVQSDILNRVPAGACARRSLTATAAAGQEKKMITFLNSTMMDKHDDRHILETIKKLARYGTAHVYRVNPCGKEACDHSHYVISPFALTCEQLKNAFIADQTEAARGALESGDSIEDVSAMYNLVPDDVIALLAEEMAAEKAATLSEIRQ
jgi:Dynamin family